MNKSAKYAHFKELCEISVENAKFSLQLTFPFKQITPFISKSPLPDQREHGCQHGRAVLSPCR